MLSEWLSYCERGEFVEQMPVTSDNLQSRLGTDTSASVWSPAEVLVDE